MITLKVKTQIVNSFQEKIYTKASNFYDRNNDEKNNSKIFD